MAESKTPLALKKQMLVMRAAVERIELASQVVDVKRAATVSAIVRNALPGNRSRSIASRALDLLKRFPFVASAAPLIASRFKFPLLKLATKWGGAATVVYKLWTLWEKFHPGKSPAPGTRRIAR